MLETIFFVSVILCKVVIACSTILLVFLGLLVFYQKKLIYIPTLNNPTSGEGTVSWDRVAPPEEFGFQKSTVDVQEEKVDLRNISKVPSDAYSFRNVSMKDGVVLKPLFLPFQSLLQKKGKNDSTPASKIATFPLIIFFQANAGNYSHRFPMISTFMQKIPAHFYIVPYRGYADSKGTPSEVAFKSDLQCIFQDILLLKTSNKFLLLSPLVLYGQSLGCALALYTYRMYYHPKDDILVILENPFISIPMMLKTMFQGWFYSLRWFVTESWDNQQEISFIKDQNTTASTKILFITAEQDEIIPHWHSFHLFKMLLSMGKTKLIDPKQSCDSFEILEKSDPDLKDISKNDSMAYEIRDREAYIEYVAGPKNINSRTVQMVLLRKGSHNDLWIQPCYFPIIKQYLTLVEN